MPLLVNVAEVRFSVPLPVIRPVLELVSAFPLVESVVPAPSASVPLLVGRLLTCNVLPALVSVTDQINDPRYPSFKGIMAAKKKPMQTWSLADLGVEPGQVGLAAAWSAVDVVTARPPRQKGQVVTDDGNGGRKLVEFLAAAKLV